MTPKNQLETHLHPNQFWARLLLRLIILVALVTVPAQIRQAWSADIQPGEEGAELAAFPRLALDVQVICQSKAIVFEIQNRGMDWPERARIEALVDSREKPLISRAMLLKNGQKASLRLKTGGKKTGAVRLAVSGGWIPEEQERHVGVRCD